MYVCVCVHNIYAFNTDLLSVYYVLGMILGTSDENRWGDCPRGAHSLMKGACSKQVERNN